MTSREDELERRTAEVYAKAIAKFPFERVEVRGEDALETWQKLKTQRRGTPVVIGNDASVANLRPHSIP
jgi:hypothetical protein